MSKMKFSRFWFGLVLLTVAAPTHAATVNFVGYGSAWNFRLGTNEASSPVTTWRTNLDNTGWSAPAATPIGYGEAAIVTPIPGSAATTPNWLSVFRHALGQHR